ncbi:MAG: WGR domain-containing protein [Deltaproteobacteria bacterium]|nr:WGR domain-containing protein [Deltaproteobacteria bacterium]
MSDWRVHLVFQDEKSDKFWRAKTEGSDLHVNFGRIGQQGQTKVKKFPSPNEAGVELEKLARSKRKKGYHSVSGDSIPPPAEPEQKPEQKPAAAPAGRSVELSLQAERRVSMRLTLDGDTVRTEVSEKHPGPAEAAQAFEEMLAALRLEGYEQEGS